MPRTRAKAPPRLTRDAERLIALANGLNASGSLTEDRFWEGEMSALVARLLENGNDAPIDGALDHLYQTNLGAYDTLIELVENESESVVVMQGDRAWQALLVAAPIVAWSKYSIPSGADSARRGRDAARSSSRRTCSPTGARVTLVPYLYSIDQLPRHFSELRKLAARLADARRHRRGAARWTSRACPETAHLLADTRFLVACAAVPRGKAALPLAGGRLGPRRPRRQPRAVDHAGAARRSPRCCPGCVFECLLPDAYYVNCRESDRRVRPFGIRAAVVLPRERAQGQARGPAGGRGRLRRGARGRVPRRLLAHRRERGGPRRGLAALRARGRDRAPRPARGGAWRSSPSAA